jgi:hypothetical protein
MRPNAPQNVNTAQPVNSNPAARRH